MSCRKEESAGRLARRAFCGGALGCRLGRMRNDGGAPLAEMVTARGGGDVGDGLSAICSIRRLGEEYRMCVGDGVTEEDILELVEMGFRFAFWDDRQDFVVG